MTREELDLLTALKRVCTEYPALALTFPDSGLPLHEEYGLGFRLLDIAHGILRHARERTLLADSPDVDPGDPELKQRLWAPGMVIDPDSPP